MKVSPVGPRGVVFTFEDLSSPTYSCPTNVFVINGKKHLFICDTFLGPKSMEPIKKYIAKNFGNDKPIVIFNSHLHWDHHWGNCAFPEAQIISHELTRKAIIQNGKEELKKNEKFLRGNVILTPPEITFRTAVCFVEDQVQFFFTPGHSNDSSSCIDLKEKILFAGDNIEEPIPYFNSQEALSTYIKTMKDYLKLDIETIIPGHGKIAKKKLLEDNLEYLMAFPELLHPVNPEKFGNAFYLVHITNLLSVGESYHKVGEKAQAKNHLQMALNISKHELLYKKERVEAIQKKLVTMD